MMAMVTHEHDPLPEIDRAAQRLTLAVNGHAVDNISADDVVHLVESIPIHHLEVEDISSALQELARG